MPQEYWSVDVSVALEDGAAQLPARLMRLDGTKLQQMSISSEGQARDVAARVSSASYVVSGSCAVLPGHCTRLALAGAGLPSKESTAMTSSWQS